MEVKLHRLSEVLVPIGNEEPDSVKRNRLMCHGYRATAARHGEDMTKE